MPWPLAYVEGSPAFTTDDCDNMSHASGSDDDSTSIEDMSDTEILSRSPPLALPRPPVKRNADPRLSLRLYKLLSRSTLALSVEF
jgi:hypothetical protein